MDKKVEPYGSGFFLLKGSVISGKETRYFFPILRTEPGKIKAIEGRDLNRILFALLSLPTYIAGGV